LRPTPLATKLPPPGWSKGVPRYFFDIQDGALLKDDMGTECANLDEVRAAAMRVLPDIAREDIPKDGDRRTFTVVVRDEDGHAVYTASLMFAGLWLKHCS
jgi:hypothetical protein